MRNHHLTISKAEGDDIRFEARLQDTAFTPHSHDYYTLALTLKGVQSFNYRGARQQSLPGEAVILHPDELHDGKTVTEEGFIYRSISIDPYQMQQCLGGTPLPFIEGGISRDTLLLQTLHRGLADLTRPLEKLEHQDIVFDLSQALRQASGQREKASPVDCQATFRAREYILENWQYNLKLEELEQVSGQDRFKLSRDFRKLLGTSPYRFVIQRRLEKSLTMLQQGRSLAETAQDCAFADQSHFTRQFRQAFGMTPRQWQKALLQ
ncbi:AraC family transcriptional regulator [Bowmanella denitrificans]|uniref:AraC family transcriptional regulator n=1 Tax=Bowmanella denitrificans TaxID=366582 RepID=A0ABN0XCS9_9ALTE